MESNANFLGGWAAAVDPVSGKTYYYNANKQTTWEKPAEMIQAEKGSQSKDEIIRPSVVQRFSGNNEQRAGSPALLAAAAVNSNMKKSSPKASIVEKPSSLDPAVRESDPAKANFENVLRSSIASAGSRDSNISSRESVGMGPPSDASRGSNANEVKPAIKGGIKLPTYGVTSLPAKPLNKVSPQIREVKEKEEPVKMTPSAIKAANKTQKSTDSPFATPPGSPPPESADFEKASQSGLPKKNSPSEHASSVPRKKNQPPTIPEKPKLITSEPSTGSTKEQAKPDIESNASNSAQSEWTKLADPATGRIYYANTKTGVTTWDPPAAFLEAAEQEDSFDIDAQLEFQRSIIQSKPTRESVSSKVLPLGFLPRAGKDSLGDIYDEILDSSTGRYYYCNRRTFQTTWEKPSKWKYLDEISDDEFKLDSEKSKLVGKHISGGNEGSAVPKAPAVLSSKAEPIKDRISVSDAGLPEQIQDEIHKFQLEGYAEQHFRTCKKRVGLAMRKVPMESLLNYQSEPLNGSLLKCSNADSQLAVKVFANICKFINPLEAAKQGATAKAVIDVGIEKPSLRDEIYCQLCKQSRKNPNTKSLALCWRLIVYCACNFPPTRGFEGFVLSHMAKFSRDPTPTTTEIQNLVVFAVWRLNRTIRNGPMKAGSLSLADIERVAIEGAPYSCISFSSSINLILKVQEANGMQSNDQVPEILKVLIKKCTDLGALSLEGIFRKAGDRNEIERIVNEIERGRLNEFKCTDPLVVADIIKIWFREMNPRIFSPDFSRAAEKLSISNASPSECYAMIKKDLPQESRETLLYLFSFCQEIAEHSSQTCMNPENLGIVFGPNMFSDLSEETKDPLKMMSISTTQNNYFSNALRGYMSSK